MATSPNWFVLRRSVDGAVISYVSDDSAGFPPNIPGTDLTGPYPSQLLAQQAVQPIVVPPSVTVLGNLTAKDSATWTLADVAEWLKAKG